MSVDPQMGQRPSKLLEMCWLVVNLGTVRSVRSMRSVRSVRSVSTSLTSRFLGDLCRS